MGIDKINNNSYLQKKRTDVPLDTTTTNTTANSIFVCDDTTNISSSLACENISLSNNSESETENIDISSIEAQLQETKEKQGFIGKLWDDFKNFTNIGAGSSKAQKTITQYKKGEISREEMEKAVNGYQKGQEVVVDVAADVASGILSVGAFALAVPTGGTSLVVGLGLACAVGTGTKVGIKASDALFNDREYTRKDLLYDTTTGAVNGLLSPVTNGIGANLTKTIGVKLIGKEAIEGTIEQVGKKTVANTLKNAIINQNIDVVGGTIAQRSVALGAGMAVDGALGGASDNMVRAALDGENAKGVLEAGVQGAVGGIILSPVIGGGFRVAGKAGKALNNKITMNKILPDGLNTKFKQGNIGDCSLLSTIDGMMNNSNTSKLIKKSVTKTFGGDYNVKIGNKVVRVTKASLTDEILSDTTGIKIFEIAYKQLNEGNLDEGFAEVVAKQFGLKPVHIANDNITDEMLDNLSKQQDNFVLSFRTKINTDGAMSTEGTSNHYFTIKNIDSDGKKLTLSSPYDTSKSFEISYDEAKALGISIDGGSVKETDIPTTVRSADKVAFKGKKITTSMDIDDETIKIFTDNGLDIEQINISLSKIYPDVKLNAVIEKSKSLGINTEDFVKCLNKKISAGCDFDEATEQVLYKMQLYKQITSSSYFTPFKLSLDEIDEIHKKINEGDVGSIVVDVLAENNFDMACHCEKIFYKPSAIYELSNLVNNANDYFAIDPKNVLNLGKINGKEKRILFDNKTSVPNVKVKINAEDLIKSNMITADLVDNASQYGLKGSVKFNIKGAEKFLTTYEAIIEKTKKSGYDSLTTYEIHALTDGLKNLYKTNPNFSKEVNKHIKENNDQFSNIYKYVEFLKGKAEPYLKKYNIKIEDHAVMRMLDRNAVIMFDTNSSKYLSFDEMIERIAKTANEGNKTLKIGNQEIELILRDRTIETIIVK